MTKPIKLIAVDLDGTLLNNHHALSERNERALRAAMAKGIHIILATGKTWSSAKELIARLNLTSPGIFVQGLIVYNADGTVRHQQTLDPSLARRVITFAEDRGFVLLAYSGSRLLLRADHPIAEDLTRFNEPLAEIVGPLQNLLDSQPIHKLIIYGEAKRLKALRWQLSMQLNGQANLTQSHIQTQLEILPSGASKGRALKALMKELGVSQDQTLAIGDAENDLEMIQTAGIGIAMGNASEKLKAIATHTVADNDHDGVAEAIERFVLDEAPQPESTEAPAAKTQEESS